MLHLQVRLVLFALCVSEITSLENKNHKHNSHLRVNETHSCSWSALMLSIPHYCEVWDTVYTHKTPSGFSWSMDLYWCLSSQARAAAVAHGGLGCSRTTRRRRRCQFSLQLCAGNPWWRILTLLLLKPAKRETHLKGTYDGFLISWMEFSELKISCTVHSVGNRILLYKIVCENSMWQK